MFLPIMEFDVMEPNAFGISVMQRQEATDNIIAYIKSAVRVNGFRISEATDLAFQRYHIDSAEDFFPNQVKELVYTLIAEGYTE